jgi:V8-like Glu-specific endopeptidase
MRLLAMSVVVGVVSGCLAEAPLGGWRGAIVDGEPTEEHDAVVYVFDTIGGAACSGSIVGPQAVLTAKHCVDAGSGTPRAASALRVLAGPSSSAPTASYFVSEVRVVPGSWDVATGNDVAVLFLASEADEEPLPMSFASPANLSGQTVTAVGYGMTPSGSFGDKLATQKKITGVDSNFLWIEPAICPGDSGGPVIGPEGSVWGVASFIQGHAAGVEPGCGTAPGAYNVIDKFQDFILVALADSGYCVPTSEEELCNGRDDNCDGEVDEGCIPLGETCSRSDECVGGLCADAGGGVVCTQRCNVLQPTVGCPPGMHCANTGDCDGLCAPGTREDTAAGLGSACSEGPQCHSLYCGEAGGSSDRCMQPCRADAGMCLYREACSVAAGCGGCVAMGEVSHPRGLGEPCSRDGHCASSQCHSEEGAKYCSRRCGSDDDCGSNFHCRSGTGGGMCIRGPRQPLGGRCVTSGDCVGGTVCARAGSLGWCTVLCSGEACPDGFECGDAADGVRVCKPTRAIVGQSCTADDDCLSRMCEAVRGSRVCTRPCGPDLLCAPGLECIRTDDFGAALCGPAGGSSGGCAAAGGGPGGGAQGHLAWVLVALLLFSSRARRALRTAAAVLLAVATFGCSDLSEFDTGPGRAYRGTVLGTDDASEAGEGAPFIRRGFAEGTVLQLTFDPALADSAPGQMWTDDTVCGEPTFDGTTLRAIPPLAHDALSQYDFPGAPRLRNYIYLALPETGALAGQEVPVFVSLIRGGRMEARILSGFGAGPCDPFQACTCFFGVFKLAQEDL